MSLRPFLAAAAVGAGLFASACIDAKDDAKGVVDDSAPPSVPSAADGKSDAANRVVALALESPHPYSNNLDRTWRLDLSVLPSCASSARVHFTVLRTEANYDYVEIAGQSFDGSHDDTWTEWFDASARAVDVRLTTDGSITRHGFSIDRVEWAGENESCPVYPLQPCPEGTLALRAPVDACECAPPPSCVGLGDATIVHRTSRGRNQSGKQTVGTVASTISTGAWDQLVTTEVGTVDAGRLTAVFEQAASRGVLYFEDYEQEVPLDQVRDSFTITAGSFTATFVAAQGSHIRDVADLIASFDALFSCAAEDAPLSCAEGRSCIDDSCQEDAGGCVCTRIYAPVCGLDGRTHGNACTAACAGIDIAHEGECGQVGDTCGGLLGAPCVGDNRCRYDASTFEAPYPDAAGVCVARTYCDAPVDCNGLPAPTVVGNWACESNACVFRAGPQWRVLSGGTFETAHPYGNGTSVWKAVTLPAGSQALRLATTGTFRLESSYDFLEVWTWTNGAWQRARRYTGTTGPALTDTFAGRYFYLRFLSDSSVVDHGFTVSAEWR